MPGIEVSRSRLCRRGVLLDGCRSVAAAGELLVEQRDDAIELGLRSRACLAAVFSMCEGNELAATHDNL